MSRRREDEEPKTEEGKPPERDRSREAMLDYALEDSFPASDPVSVEHSDHAGGPPDHSPTSEDKRPPGSHGC